jgi:hypothetical protein
MTLHWVLQNNFKGETGMVRLVELLAKYDIPFTEVKVVPFEGTVIPDLSPEGNVICFGSYSMRHTAKKKGWFPGVFDLGEKAKDIYSNSWAKHVLNTDTFFCKFEDVGNLASKVIRYDEDFFMRPVLDSKVFAGIVLNFDEYWDWMRKVVVLEQDDGSSLRGDTLVQFSSAKKIYSEYRLFVIGGKVITASKYKQGHTVIYDRNVDQDILDFGQMLVDQEDFAPAYCLDLCRTQDGIKIVEVNTVNSCGLYDADVDKIIKAFQEIYG